jgi:hypothetical protein
MGILSWRETVNSAPNSRRFLLFRDEVVERDRVFRFWAGNRRRGFQFQERVLYWRGGGRGWLPWPAMVRRSAATFAFPRAMCSSAGTMMTRSIFARNFSKVNSTKIFWHPGRLYLRGGRRAGAWDDPRPALHVHGGSCNMPRTIKAKEPAPRALWVNIAGNRQGHECQRGHSPSVCPQV